MRQYKVIDLPKGTEWSFWTMTLLDNHKLIRSLSSCRSFVCDNLFKLKFPEYGKEYVSTSPYNYKKGFIYVLVSLTNNCYKERFLSHLHLLHEKEDIAKVRRSVVYSTENKSMFVIEGSKYWKDSCWKLMLYTFYIKCLCYKKMTDCDPTYWEPLLKNNNELTLLKKIRDKGEFISKEVYGEKLDRGMHDKEGFVAICSGRNNPMAKHLGVKV